MPYEPFEPVTLGRTALRPTRLGFGTAEIGGLYRSVEDADAVEVLHHAWDLGIRYFDSAPLYGYGNAERRLGLGVAGRPRDALMISTKVGRLLVPVDEVAPGADVDRQSDGRTDDAFYAGTPPVRVVFDYSGEGVRRSVEASLRRLGQGRIDILYIHDPDDHWQEALDGAYPALHRLREQGVVGAIGAGMNQAAMLARFARETDMDVFMVAGRYTLLDHDALPELLPECLARGIAVVVAGVMNSGLLADPHRTSARFDYRIPPRALVERARRLDEICHRHDVPLRAAAMQFPLAHPAVSVLVTGVRTREHLVEYPRLLRMAIPPDLWAELRDEGLLPAEAPVPTAAAPRETGR